MTRKTRILTTATGIAVATTIGFSAFLARAGTTVTAAAQGPVARRLAQLGLSGEQKTEVKDILRKYQPTVGPLVRQLVDARRTLRDTIRGETIDEPALRAQAAKVASLEADLAVQRAHVAHDLRSVLAPGQIQQLKEMQADVDQRIDALLSRVARRVAED